MEREDFFAHCFLDFNWGGKGVLINGAMENDPKLFYKKQPKQALPAGELSFPHGGSWHSEAR